MSALMGMAGSFSVEGTTPEPVNELVTLLPPGTMLVPFHGGEAHRLTEPLLIPTHLLSDWKGKVSLGLFWGVYDFEFFEDGSVPKDKNGNWLFGEGVVRNRATARNLMPTVALTSVLNVYLAAATPITAWYCGLVDNSGFSAFAAGDTSASHAGWTEFASYSEGTRQTWTPGSVSAGSVTNTSAMVFTPSAGGTLKGAFLISNNTKSGSTGTIYSEAGFDAGNQTVTNGTPFRLNGTFTAASAS